MSRVVRTPLPKIQVALLLYLQLAEPITSTVIYPFINQAVRELGITGGDEKKTGYYAGLIESCFYVTEALCVLQWGRASDIVGRRPVLLGGLFGLTLSMLGFGLSKQYWSLVLSRCAQGALNGNVGVTKCMMGEITDPSNRAQGFAFTSVVWSVGATLGSLIGGLLANPADHWPRAFAAPFWKTYPYFLPCLVTACYSISAVILTSMGLKETLPAALERAERRKHRRHTKIILAENRSVTKVINDVPSLSMIEKPASLEGAITWDKMESDGQADCKSLTQNTSSQEIVEVNISQIDHYEGRNPSLVKEQVKEQCVLVSPDAPNTGYEHRADSGHPTLRSLLIPRIVWPIVNYGFLAFLDQCYTVLQPLMYSSPLAAGGLGVSTLNIGLIIGGWGALNIVIQVLAFRPIHDRLGTRTLYTLSIGCYALCFGAFPLIQLLTQRSGHIGVGAGVVWAIQLVICYMAKMAYGCIFILITDGAPNRAALGATNGLAQTTASTMRAIAPATASSLFALSLERNLAGGALVYCVMAVIALLGVGASRYLPARLQSQG